MGCKSFRAMRARSMAIIRIQLSIDVDTSNGQAVVVNQPTERANEIPHWYDIAFKMGLVKALNTGECLLIECKHPVVRDFGLFCSQHCAHQVIPNVKKIRRALIREQKAIAGGH